MATEYLTRRTGWSFTFDRSDTLTEARALATHRGCVVEDLGDHTAWTVFTVAPSLDAAQPDLQYAYVVCAKHLETWAANVSVAVETERVEVVATRGYDLPWNPDW